LSGLVPGVREYDAGGPIMSTLLQTAPTLRPPGLGFADHPLRDVVLGEIHSRPFLPLETPARLLHFGFTTDPDQAAADRRALTALCGRLGVEAPAPGAKHLYVRLSGCALRWEQHSEFTTYTIIVEGAEAQDFGRARAVATPIIAQIPPPGPLLVSAALSLIPFTKNLALETNFDVLSLAVASVGRGEAVIATDFRLRDDGFVHILVADKSLTRNRAGALAQRLLEVETYRTLALLGLPMAQVSGPRVNAVEAALSRVSRQMTQTAGLDADHALLDEMTRLAAELEADRVATSFRFGASRAYDGLVQNRLSAIGEESVESWSTLASFLSRRMAPAMRTCEVLQERQTDLSLKLNSAANLLRTRVDVAIERQNRDLLQSMNDRTRLQLRLQQTVEGLSVAAISYYIVGLVGYVSKGVKELGYGPEPAIVQAIAVPFIIIGIALVVRRIRRAHGDGEH